MLTIIEFPSKEEVALLLKRPDAHNETLTSVVEGIINDVKVNRDEAIYRLTKVFDAVTLESFTVTKEEIQNSAAHISDDLKKAIEVACQNISKFHTAQQDNHQRIETMPGVTCWRRSVAIEKVGLYVPGGTAPLISTVMMLGIPAKIAGCKEIIICSPPNSEGKIHPAILYTAQLIGIHTIYKIGGAQTIAAMAFGTQTVPKVDKIFGPGNKYVTAAKQMVNSLGTAIDMPAGPSEVAILSDHTGNPMFIASEILSQAEHGNDSQAIVITTSKDLALQINKEVKKQLQVLERKDQALKGLASSRIIVVKTLDEGIQLINEYAPEHLVIQTENLEEVAMKIENAGSVFLGEYTPVAAGDYGSGTNHTLPTNGFAKAYSGVSLDSFVKTITYQQITKEGLNNIAPTIKTLAEAEGLTAHRNSIILREDWNNINIEN